MAPRDIVSISLLRPPPFLDGVRDSDARPVVFLSMPELVLSGWARVLAVRPAPEVETGPGRVVTGTFTHVNDNLHVLRFVGSGATLEATGVHRFYSLDRNDWAAAQELRPSERLQTVRGEVVLAGVERSAEAQRVYNIEVEGDHEYVVGELGVRTHNSYGGADTVGELDPTEFAGKTPSEIDALARQKGLTAKGPDPKAGRGAYVDKDGKTQRVVCHACGGDRHAHVNNPAGERLDINGKVVPAESAEAHLPIGEDP